MSRIIVFGGTFNPVTKAHLSMAHQAMDFLDASKVIFVPTDMSFLKNWKHMDASACFGNSSRVTWLQKAVENEPNFECSLVEVNQKTHTTYETLSYLHHLNPNDELIFLCGDDKWDEFIHWYNWDLLIKSYRFCIVSRQEENVASLMKESHLYNDVWDRFFFLSVDKTYADVSSTKVRNAIANGDKAVIKACCPQAILDDIYALMQPDHQTIKVASSVIEVVNGNVLANSQAMLKQINKAKSNGCALISFSELALTGASCKDLYYRPYLYQAIEKSITSLMQSMDEGIVALIGAPLQMNRCIYDGVYVLVKHKLLAIVVKETIPMHQRRYFTSGHNVNTTIHFQGQTVPVGTHFIFDIGGAKMGVEIGEDGFAPIKARNELVMHGVNLVMNLSCIPYCVGQDSMMEASITSDCYYGKNALVFTNGGRGESSSDYVYDSLCFACDSDGLLGKDTSYLETVVDLGKLNYHQSKLGVSWDNLTEVPIINCLDNIARCYLPERVNPFPYLPETISDKQCCAIIDHQAQSLMARLNAIHCKDVVIGVSGGLDSTLALIVCYQAFKHAKYDFSGIHAISMPGFGTSSQTKSNGNTLMDLVGCSSEMIDIKQACLHHFNGIGHDPYIYDVTYENTQARERTQILFDKANQLNAIVIGTGDMSEIALGWCTYNGDHMSNYGVNASIPKTVMKRLLLAYANEHPIFANVLQDIIDTPISPELLPSKDNEFAQKTENSVGKYELQDFFMYHYLHNGYGYDKMYALACIAFDTIDTIAVKNTLDIFYRRFYSQQFKRNCAPEAVDLFDISLNASRGFNCVSDIGNDIEFLK